jgi:hypothetical protein
MFFELPTMIEIRTAARESGTHPLETLTMRQQAMLPICGTRDSDR